MNKLRIGDKLRRRADGKVVEVVKVGRYYAHYHGQFADMRIDRKLIGKEWDVVKSVADVIGKTLND